MAAPAQARPLIEAVDPLPLAGELRDLHRAALGPGALSDEWAADRLPAHVRRSGFVFHNGSGDPLNQRIALDQLHDVLSKIGVEPCGFHAFRRFRNTHLRKAHVPDRLTQYWMGHAPVSMTDNYDRVREDLEFRRFTAEQVGIGFIPPVARQPVSAVSPRVTPSSESVTI